MISFLPEHYLIFCIFVLLSFFCIYSLSIKHAYPKLHNGMLYLSFISLLNFLFLNAIDFSFSSIYFSDSFIKNDFSSIIIILMSIFTIALVLNFSSYNKNNNINYFEFYILVMLVLFSSCLLISSIEFFSFYFILELQGVILYILASFNRLNKKSIESGIKYLILNSFSSVILLLGFSFIYAITGTFSFIDIAYLVSTVDSQSLLLKFSSVFIVTSFLFKIYNAPFHFWIADIYEGSPTSSVSVFSIIPLLSVFYSFSKMIELFYSSIIDIIYSIYFFVSILTIIVGTLFALYQRNLKKLLAYSTVTNIGYLLSTTLNSNALGFLNGFLFVCIYLFNLLGIFILIMSLYDSRKKRFLDNIHSFSGFLKTHRNYSFFFICYLFSLGGIPPFSLFLSKLFIITSLLNHMNYIIIATIICSTFLTSFYYIRIVKLFAYNSHNIWFFIKPSSYIVAYSIVFGILTQFILLFFMSNFNILYIN